VVVGLATIGLVAGAASWPGPAAADAGAELAYSVVSGPPGTTFGLSSPDTFDMGVDLCPGPVGGDTPTGDHELRWELAPLQSGGIAVGDQLVVVTSTDPVGTPVATGAVPTAAGEPWSAEVTVPDDVAPGTRLVVHAACTSVVTGDPLFDFYYMPVFLVTAPGTAPSATNVPPTSASTVTAAPTSAPPGPAPAPAPASPRSGRATFTG
jgi:hypothetical protein